MGRRISFFLLAAALAAAPAPAHAWGATGHELVSGVGADLFPAELPGFLRIAAARRTIGELGRELDRSKGAGKTHDSERDPGHFLDLADNGAVMSAVPLNALPETRGDYDAALSAAGFDQYKAGYLPYAIVDGWQQLVKDFAYWRADSVAQANARTAADRAWFKADRLRREQLILRDAGVWSHYIGDGSQPQHVTVHYDAWGDFPNPQSFTTKKGFHARFEGVFVKTNVTPAMVRAQAPAFHDCACPIFERVERYLQATNAEVVPLFTLEAKGAFPAPLVAGDGLTLLPDPAHPAPPEGIAFAAARLGAGAAEFRDLVVLAWRASANGVVGYPGVNVADVESRKVILSRALYAND